MAMRIGVILGSAHGTAGATGSLVGDLIDRVAEYTEVTVDTVVVEDLGLGPSCPACLSCMTAGERTCPSFERAAPARRVMQDSDVVVFATPVHSFHVSAAMKRFVDHFAYLIHRPAHVGKPAVLVSSAAGGGHDAALGYLHTAVRRWGFHTVGQLGVNSPGLRRSRYRASVDRALDDLAAIVMAAPAAPETSPTTADLIGFRVARLIVEGGREDGPVDAAYWTERGWFDADWYTDVKVPFVANRVAGLVEGRIRKGMADGSAKPYRG